MRLARLPAWPQVASTQQVASVGVSVAARAGLKTSPVGHVWAVPGAPLLPHVFGVQQVMSSAGGAAVALEGS